MPSSNNQQRCRKRRGKLGKLHTVAAEGMGATHLRSCISITYVVGTDDGMLVFLYYVVVVHNYQRTVGEIGVFAAMIGM